MTDYFTLFFRGSLPLTPSFRPPAAPGTFLTMRMEEIEPHMKFLRNGSVLLKNIEARVTASVLAEKSIQFKFN